MSQHDFDIANQTFPSFRSDLNDALQAAATISAGATAPTTPYAYQLWFDTSTNTYKARNAANSAWVSLFGTDLTNGGVTFGDNDKAIFGAGSDLQIYHDGSDSYVRDNGTGDLYIEGSDDIRFRTTAGETYAVFNENSSVNLYHDNTLKFETASTGVDILSTDATVNFVSSRGTGATHTITTGGANSQNFNINAATGGDIYVNAENKIFRNAAGSSEHMRVDQHGNVLAGTTSIAVGQGTTTGVSVRGPIGRIEASASGNTSAIFNRTTSDGSIVNFSKDGGTVGSIGARQGDLTIGTGTSGLQFYDSASEIFPVNINTNTATDGTVTLGDALVRFKNLYLSGGVYLGGTGSANYLDDYEEGTWTPVIEGATTAGTATYGAQNGVYTKIGRVIHLQYYVSWSSHTGTGNFRVSGLPSTSASSTYSAGSLFMDNINLGSTAVQANSYIASGSNSINIYRTRDNAGWAIQGMDAAGSIIGSMFYVITT